MDCRLGLGTVQFGLAYGIANTQGKIPVGEVGLILDEAERRGVRVLDTAPAYGESESVLGRFALRERAFRLVTKTLPICGKDVPADAMKMVREGLERSWRRLGEIPLAGVLVHHGEELLSPLGDGLWKILEDLRQDGRVERLGASFYDPETLEKVLRRFPLELVQIPLNPLDQRFLPLLDTLKARQVEIHGRSCFLQGLLLLPLEKLDPFFEDILPVLRRFRRFLQEKGLSPLEGCLGFCLGVPQMDCLLVGVDSVGQLREIFQAARPLQREEFASFAVWDKRIVEPFRWKISLQR